MSKPAKPAAPAAPAEGAAPPKSKKMLFIIIGVVVLLIAAGAGWYFTQGHAPKGEHAAEAKAEPVQEPKYIPLGENFTVNLLHEENDQYLQVGISLKILDPAIEGLIKARMPEIKSKLLFLLSNKLPSELQTAAGKQQLVREIIKETDTVLGMGKAHGEATTDAHAQEPATEAHNTAPEAHAASTAEAASAPSVVAEAAPPTHKTTGIVDVLFTAFIIQ